MILCRCAGSWSYRWQRLSPVLKWVARVIVILVAWLGLVLALGGSPEGEQGAHTVYDPVEGQVWVAAPRRVAAGARYELPVMLACSSGFTGYYDVEFVMPAHAGRLTLSPEWAGHEIGPHAAGVPCFTFWHYQRGPDYSQVIARIQPRQPGTALTGVAQVLALILSIPAEAEQRTVTITSNVLAGRHVADGPARKLHSPSWSKAVVTVSPD